MRDFELADYTRSMTINKKRRARGSRTPFFTNSQASPDYYEVRFSGSIIGSTIINGAREFPAKNGRADLFSSIAEQGKDE